MADIGLTRFARVFVAGVFVFLAITFLASLATIVIEFDEPDLWFILAANSNLFVFFPTLGIVALAAFYVPAVIFTDLYWRRRVSYGRERFIFGCIVVASLSVYLSETMNASPRRPLWEIAPAKLEQEFNRPASCARDAKDGCRPTLLGATRELREQSLTRLRLSPLVRECTPDPLLERPLHDATPRYCFPGQRKLDADACCAVQKQLASSTFGLWSTPELRSTAALLDRWLFLPLKTFFVIVIVVIGLFLIRWKSRLIEHYSPLLPAMERGLQIGALAMLPWLIMDYGNQQVSDILYGPGGGFPMRLSLVLIPWAVLLAGYFADRVKVGFANLVRGASGVISVAAYLNYRDVFDWSAKALGVGAPPINFLVLAGVCVVAFVYLCRWLPGALRGEDKGDADTDATAVGAQRADQPPIS